MGSLIMMFIIKQNFKGNCCQQQKTRGNDKKDNYKYFTKVVKSEVMFL